MPRTLSWLPGIVGRCLWRADLKWAITGMPAGWVQVGQRIVLKA
jgi:hypothetical protein